MYTSPSITDLGTLREMTSFGINKTGKNADVLSGINIPGVGVVGNGSHVVFTP